MNRKRVVLIGILAIGVIVVGGAAAYEFVIKPMDSGPPSAAQLAAWQYSVPKITTNLQDNGIIEMQVTLQAPSAAVAAELSDRAAQVEDAVIAVLHGLSGQQIMQPGGRHLVKLLVLKRINSFLTSGKVTEVYIDSLIVQ
ncbi:flagellar basal body-associated FliL family protein [Sulfoacidibacillus thermotolerans]|uniref:Flagellar protein FliL n=1 Tax=Sulfoacidibacillus thermotolerans TaxID=1765684 RepID=A0A2U3DA85_SULT2|nr:flagellar basal body-associated FliL family protein [Sulfoacidibacillus thermotolerans]PWI58194.1 hypothetical protein BM613_04480 [Sulfoacidibacillus thermotolerans]